MDSVYQRVKDEAERQCGARGWQQWLAEQLTAVKEPGEPDYTTQRLQNWKYRGIPPGEHQSVALALGKTVDWIVGMEAPERPVEKPEPELPPAAATGVIEQLGALLDGVSELTRASLAPLLERLARNPAEAERIARTIDAVLHADSPPPPAEPTTASGLPVSFADRRVTPPAQAQHVQHRRGMKIIVNPPRAVDAPMPGELIGGTHGQPTRRHGDKPRAPASPSLPPAKPNRKK